MRKILSVVTVVAMVGSALPVSLGAAVRQDATGGVQGTARSAQQQPLAGHTVQIRNVQSGQLAATGTTDASGQFQFAGLAPGSYVVEIVNASGAIIGTTAPIAVAAGSTATVSVTASAAGALAASQGAGFSIFGLGTAASAAIIGGVAVGITAGVIAVKDDASPSR
jgi:hypothetical protein